MLKNGTSRAALRRAVRRLDKSREPTKIGSYKSRRQGSDVQCVTHASLLRYVAVLVLAAEGAVLQHKELN